MNAIKDIIERMLAVGDKHDRILADYAAKELAQMQAKAAAQDATILYAYTALSTATKCGDDNRPLEALVRLAVQQLAATPAKDEWREMNGADE